MKLDEAIRHAEKVAKQSEIQADKWQEEGGEEWGKTIACRKCAEEHRQLAEWLKELKRVREQTRWIPCSERLPKEHGYYIVQTDGSHNAVIDIAEYGIFFRKPEYEYVWEWNKASKILAWMPLPEPYKEEGDAE